MELFGIDILFVCLIRYLIFIDNWKASWVSAEQIEIGNKFSEFIREDSQQRVIESLIHLILLGNGEIWIETCKPRIWCLECRGFSFYNCKWRYRKTDNLCNWDVVIPTISPETIPSLPDPSPEISSEIVNMWSLVKKAAAVYMVFDTSGSMSEQGKMEVTTT